MHCDRIHHNHTRVIWRKLGEWKVLLRDQIQPRLLYVLCAPAFLHSDEWMAGRRPPVNNNASGVMVLFIAKGLIYSISFQQALHIAMEGWPKITTGFRKSSCRMRLSMAMAMESGRWVMLNFRPCLSLFENKIENLLRSAYIVPLWCDTELLKYCIASVLQFYLPFLLSSVIVLHWNFAAAL